MDSPTSRPPLRSDVHRCDTTVTPCLSHGFWTCLLLLAPTVTPPCRPPRAAAPDTSTSLLRATAYVDDQLLATGKISKAAILGKQGGVWAASSGYSPEQDFITQTAFTDPDTVRANGITLNGFKFMALQANDTEVIGRKGERGVFIIPTTQAILVGEYDGTAAGEANVVVSKLADYLKSVGY
ncbi:actin monomer binding protein [Trichosporon asahii var. asahii CBS 8904]|uniref:Profilin n=2 Tax=Trichosporon asahii var. asahii TaxID=189963 RepID=K1WU46_TRIAC|nr:actin monomer binding protein [Trichosporon asahii var. asahii CBS 2479]EJT46767.1 actin monomer binding protein [Trichosporon asahii var. asahii CBS 2479]EKD04434.1 actin monomer binding protein [Trichosporon asahii var. asahii CBS 8904]